MFYFYPPPQPQYPPQPYPMRIAKRPQEKQKKRRLRTPWLDSEIKNLIIGTYNFGIGKWALIHSHMEFQKLRTYIDLKDKWRNLVDHRNCARTPILYRAVSAVIQKKQTSRGFMKPEKLLGPHDWDILLQIYGPEVEAEIQILGDTSSTSPCEPLSPESEDSQAITVHQPISFPQVISPTPNFQSLNTMINTHEPKVSYYIPPPPLQVPSKPNLPHIVQNEHQVAKPVTLKDILW